MTRTTSVAYGTAPPRGYTVPAREAPTPLALVTRGSTP